MLKSFLLAATTIFLLQTAYAETCPSVQDIKNNSITGWKFFDSDEGIPLAEKRISEFKKSVDKFALAEWADQNKKSGSIHCYYQDKNGSDLEAYLSKDNFAPDNAHDYWYQVSGFSQCAAGSDKCAFNSVNAAPAQLAKK